MELIADISEEYSQDLSGDPEYRIIPKGVQQATGIPVDYHGTIRFDPQACLKACKGECCRNKNYLMINIHDIFRILSSKGAQFYDINSTIDLFDRKPPLVELFYIEEYRMFFPYIRYLPVNADVHSRPENAEESICPFCTQSMKSIFYDSSWSQFIPFVFVPGVPTYSLGNPPQKNLCIKVIQHSQ